MELPISNTALMLIEKWFTSMTRARIVKPLDYLDSTDTIVIGSSQSFQV